MRKLSNCLAGLFVLATLFSCQSKKQDQTPTLPVALENRIIRQNKGTDCDKQPDSLRTDCAMIDFSVPKVKGTGDQSVLGKNLTAWSDKFLIHLLTWSDYNEPGKEPFTVDAAINRFHAIHDAAKGSVSSGMFKALCINNEWLNDGAYLTMSLDGYSFSGGNRALEVTALATFDAKTGKQLTWDDLVKNKSALLPIADQMVRQTRAEAFGDGFEFDKREPLALPASFGLTTEGVVFHYQSDEIYGLGGSTEFTVPFSVLGANLKVLPPAPLPADSASDATAGIYQVQGNDLIIPPFEIEVNSSAAADKTLSKRKETIIVSAMFWGYSKDPNDKARSEDGSISILNKEIELSGNQRLARFEGLKFDRKLLDKMEDPDLMLLINIYSGRKSTDDNLLEAGILEMKAGEFGNKRFVLPCKLISEPAWKNASGYPDACYALPEAGAAAGQKLSFVVDCSEKGAMQFAGRPVKNYDELMSILRPLLAGMLKKGIKAENLPGITTQGCMSGNSSTISDYYDEMKDKLTGKAKPADLGSTAPKTTTPKIVLAAKSVPVAKPARVPTVTLKQNGSMFVNNTEVADLDGLRKVLQAALLKESVIPDKLALKTVGQTGMGMRGEMNTIIAESIAGAKWVRKKNALAALNTAVGKKLGTTTQLEVVSYQTSGNFACINAKPKLADGRPVDYRQTAYAADYAAGKIIDNAVVGLLQYDKGAWKLLTYSIGVGKAPADVWAKKYGAPKGVFGGAGVKSK
ncbi:MAG TPA: RsiV family protein [Saprospiraceae bacterium]|nr:RsiV family protein [Saprospiraceae bacterium]